MAGLITVRGFRQVVLGGNVTLLFEGNKVGSVSPNKTVDIPIDNGGVLSSKIGVNPKCGSFTIEDGMHTTLQLKYDRLSGKVSFELVSQEPYGEQQKDAYLASAPIYDIEGVRGRSLKVYEDKCIISTRVNMGSLLTGNVTDGDKTIYYADVLGVQYKASSMTIGYLQLETASSQMNNRRDNFFNENSFTFDDKLNDKMDEVAKYVQQKVEEAKSKKNAPTVVAAAVSAADELKKFKELLDLGIITQEEFDAKKKQLLGL